jgi:hypothetical protein
VVNYLNGMLASTLQFFGCAEQGTTSRLTYFLIPQSLAGHSFTTADLDALNDWYLAAVEQSLSDNGSPPLTNEQVYLINRKLTRLSRRVPNVHRSSDYTFSTCPAGTPNLGADPVPDDDLDCR